MIFLDNSSSSFYKPSSVIKAVANTLEFLPFNASRAGHSGAVKAGMLVYNVRNSLASCFGASVERVIFTGGCTEALNLGLLSAARPNSHIITTRFEHNSVLRPLYHLSRTKNIRLSVVASPAEAAAKVSGDTSLFAINHISNVTGAEANIAEYSRLAKKCGALLLVDAAQSAGHLPINIRDCGIDLLAIAPHKGLHSPQGVGALLVADGIKLTPLKLGGTGTASSSPVQPDDFPEGFESGTLPLPAIAGVGAGLKYTLDNFEFARKKLFELSGYFLDLLSAIEGVRVYSRPNHCGIVAFNLLGYTSSEAGDILSEQYDIAVRCGFHCAPLLHEYFGTKNGMIRASMGVNNTYAELDFVANAIIEMLGN